MSKAQKVGDKRKAREKESKAKVARRREALRKHRKEVASQDQQDREAFYLRNGKPEPILNDPQKVAEREARKQSDVKRRLEKNIAILEALETQYEEEQANRKQANEQLESEGFKTIKEKMDALHKRALEITGKGDELDKAQKEAENTVEEKV